MHARREGNSIFLGLSYFESHVLRQILTFISETYGKKPSELDPQASAAWYSKRGCESAGMSLEETEDWLKQMHEYRSARRTFIEQCVQGLRPKESAKCCGLR